MYLDLYPLFNTNFAAVIKKKTNYDRNQNQPVQRLFGHATDRKYSAGSCQSHQK